MSFPPVPADEKGARFRLKERNDYQKRTSRLTRVLTFDVAKGTPYSAPTTADGLPKLFQWEPGTYELDGVVLQHFSTWIEPLPEAAFLPSALPTPLVEGFQSSPKKVRREMNAGGMTSASAVNLADV